MLALVTADQINSFITLATIFVVGVIGAIGKIQLALAKLQQGHEANKERLENTVKSVEKSKSDILDIAKQMPPTTVNITEPQEPRP